MKYLPEPGPASDAAPTERAAVVLFNLGTPQAPTAAAVRRYLAEFLSDPRVVEIPRLVWWPILHGVVLRTRPRLSAAKYASIWTPAGSPLKVYTEQQALLLRGYLGDRGIDVDVFAAMRYGEPSIPSAFSAMRERRVGRVLLIPLYPQYSATTTGSTIDAVGAVLSRTRNVPEVRWVKQFHDDPGYVAALAQSIRKSWSGRTPGDRLLMSFHGVPRRMVELGDPYYDQCIRTAERLAAALAL
ncbi:MAG TPA: ferrochelatase, partial [Burkholderiaceae bacterium]|nr:ferrochelatase [Burkholderiaceae bacterium]